MVLLTRPCGFDRHLKGDLVQVGGSRQRNRAVDRRGYHHFRFRYAGNFPHYRYMDLEDEYDGARLLPAPAELFLAPIQLVSAACHISKCGSTLVCLVTVKFRPATK